ncbi:MAG TPA: signal peptidase I [Symbiobacteriaceae bacterium]|nr:signal peptidase I [Symbiobacteriaceae bacterium]
MADITEVPPRGKRKGPLREVVETLALALVIALVIRFLLVEVYRVEGTSMEATLHSGERVLVNKFIYRWRIRAPRPGDIIVLQYPKEPDRDFIKRVVAVAGDKVEIRAGKVYVNGVLFKEAPGVRLSDEDSRVQWTVPPDHVWVLGDNRNNSEDSRSFDAVDVNYIRGLAFLRVWPLTRICRFINPTDATAESYRGVFVCP